MDNKDFLDALKYHVATDLDTQEQLANYYELIGMSKGCDSKELEDRGFNVDTNNTDSVYHKD